VHSSPRLPHTEQLAEQLGVSAAGRRTCCALRIFAAATICMALVICEVFLTDLMRRRMSRVFAAMTV
jgi:hypothetical protein